MRVWVIFLLIFVISFAAAYSNRKAGPPSKKDVATSTADNDDDLPPIGDGDEEELKKAEEEEDEKLKNSIKKPSKKAVPKKRQEEDDKEATEDSTEGKQKAKAKPASKSRKPDSAEEDESEDVCGSKESMCICSSTELDCHAEEDEEFRLNTANLNIKAKAKEFKLLKADFSRNSITQLRKGQLLSKREAEVQELIFTHNKISKIEADVFKPFTNLTKLHLDGNLISKLSPEMFNGLEGLHQLHLKNNKLTTIPDKIFQSMKSLKKLVLDGNKITFKKEIFEGLDQLEELSIDNCNVKDDLPMTVFNHLLSLKKLSLRGNPILDVPKALKALNALEHLDISETDIPELHTASFHDDMNLKTLRIENMKNLYAIHEKAFCGLRDLTELYMANNKILYLIHPDAFGMDTGSELAAVALKTVDFSNCNISIISEDTLYFQGLDTLSIGGNPWNCTCDTAFLLGDYIYDFDYGSPMPKCKYPADLDNVAFTRIQPTQACSQLGKKRTVWRGVKVLSILLLLTVLCVSLFMLYTKGYIQNLFKTARSGAPAFPSMTYSNLNNTDDGRSLETDFQPRPEDV